MTTGRRFRGAALTARPVVGDAWRRCCAGASVPYLLTTADAGPIVAAAAEPDAPVPAVLVDLLSGAGTVAALRRAGAAVVLLAPVVMSPAVRAALGAGVDALVTVRDPLASLRTAVSMLVAGEAYASPAATRLLLDEHWHRRGQRDGTGDVSLTARERAVLQAMVDGLTTKGTARQLGISSKTVEAHRSRIFARLRVTSQAQAITRALTDEALLGRT